MVFAVSLCPSLGAAGLVATEFEELVAAVLGGVTGGGEGSGVLLEGAGDVVGEPITGWLEDEGMALSELAETAGATGATGAAGVAGVEGVARGAGVLLGATGALVVATTFAGAFVAFSTGAALAGLGASSTAGRASATIAGFSASAAATGVVAAGVFAGGGVTSAIVLSARW